MPVSAKHRKTQVAVDHENREKDDFYPTPPAATEALLRAEPFTGRIWEPACGDGAISKVLAAAGHEVISTDLVARGFGDSRVDFLFEYQPRAENIITNPPFKLAMPFLRKSLELTPEGGKVAFLLRLAFLEGKERGKFFAEQPPQTVYVFSERVHMYSNGESAGKAGGMIAFAWFVWQKGYRGNTRLAWL